MCDVTFHESPPFPEFFPRMVSVNSPRIYPDDGAFARRLRLRCIPLGIFREFDGSGTLVGLLNLR